MEDRVYERSSLEASAEVLLEPVTWPRYMEGNAGIIDAGLEDIFSSL